MSGTAVDNSLYFVSRIELDGLKRDVAAIEQHLKKVTSTAGQEAQKFDDTYRKLATAVAGYFSFQALSGFGQQLIAVRGEFQQLGIALETMLGSKEKADQLTAQIVDLSAKTPFSLREVGQGAKQLMAFQVAQGEVIDTLTRLGNVASGVSVPIDQLIRAYGQVKAKGKLMGDDLRQFTEAGIPMIHELAKVFNVTDAEISKMVETGKVGFPDVQKVIQNLTNEGGMFFNLMEKQSKSLSGLVSNLGDAWDRMLNNIGAGNEGLLAGGITGLTDLVNNYEKVIDIVKVLTATYGAYKAATIVASVATNGLTIAENLHYAALLVVEKAQKILNATALANPYVAVATTLTAVVGGLMLYSKWTEKSAQVSDEFKNNLKSEVSAIEKTFEAVKKTAEGSDARKKAIQEINEKYKDYLPNLLSEKDGLDKIAEAQDKVTTAMAKSLAFRAQEKELEDIKKQTQEAKQAYSDLINEIFGNRKKYTAEDQGKATAALEKYLETAKSGEVTIKKIQEALSSFGINVDITKQSNFRDLENIWNALAGIDDKLLGKKTYLSALNDENKAMSELKVVYDAYLKSLGLIGQTKEQTTQGGGVKSAARTVEVIDAEISALQKEQKTLSDTSTKWEDYNKRIDALNKERDAITGNKKEDNKQQKDQQKETEDYQKYLDDLLSRTASYDEKKKQLYEKYITERQDLAVYGNAANVAELDKQYKAESDALDAENFKKLKSYRWVYDQIEIMGAKGLQLYISRLKTEIENFKGNEEVKLELTKKLAEAEQALTGKAPLAAIKNINSKLVILKSQIAQAKTEAQKVKLEAEAANLVAQKGQILSGQLQEASSLLSGMGDLVGQFDEGLGNTLKTVAELGSGIANAVSSFSSGNVLGGITASIGVFSTLVKLLNNDGPTGSEKLEKWIARLVKILELQKKSLDLLTNKDQVSEYDKLLKTIDSQLDRVDKKMQKGYQAYQAYLKRALNKDEGMLGELYNTLIKKDKEMKYLLDKNFADLTNDDWLKMIENSGGDLNKQLKMMYEEWLELQKQQQQYINAQNELITGSTYDSIVSSIVDGFADGYDSAADFAASFEELMRKALLQSLQVQYLEQPLQEWYNQFANANKDGLTQQEIDSLKAAYNAIITGAANYASSLEVATGITLGNAEKDRNGTLSGAISGASQESIDVLSGYMAAMRIYLADIHSAITGNFNSDLKNVFNTDELSSTFGLGLSTMNGTLVSMRDAALTANDYLFKIEINTRELAAIKGLLAENLKDRGYGESFLERRFRGR